MTDPKQLLDEEIEEALVEEQVVMTTSKPTTPKPTTPKPTTPKPTTPKPTTSQRRNPLGALAIDGKWVRPFTVVLGVSAAISSLAVIVAKVWARRTPRFTGIVLRVKHPRRFGYGRYRFGRFGQAFLTYTYKVPEVRIHMPHLTYRLPSMRVKLPVSSR